MFGVVWWDSLCSSHPTGNYFFWGYNQVAICFNASSQALIMADATSGKRGSASKLAPTVAMWRIRASPLRQ